MALTYPYAELQQLKSKITQLEKEKLQLMWDVDALTARAQRAEKGEELIALIKEIVA